MQQYTEYMQELICWWANREAGSTYQTARVGRSTAANLNAGRAGRPEDKTESLEGGGGQYRGNPWVVYSIEGSSVRVGA